MRCGVPAACSCVLTSVWAKASLIGWMREQARDYREEPILFGTESLVEVLEGVELARELARIRHPAPEVQLAQAEGRV